MAMRLEELRIGMDNSGYVQGAREVSDANAKMTAGAGQLGAAVEATERRLGQSNTALERLKRQHLEGYAAAQSFERGQRMIDKALEQGRITGTDHAKMLASLKARYGEIDGAASSASGAVEAGSRRLSAAVSHQRNFSLAVQNSAYQVGDFAVQMASGTDATRALAQQLPQLLGGFGVFGAVAGAVVAIGGGIAATFMNAAGESERARKRQDEFNSALDGAVPIIERYLDAQDQFAGRADGWRKQTEQIRELRAEVDLLEQTQPRRKTAGFFDVLFGGRSADGMPPLDIQLQMQRESLISAERAARETPQIEARLEEAKAAADLAKALGAANDARSDELRLAQAQASGNARDAAVMQAVLAVRERYRDVGPEFADVVKTEARLAGQHAAALYDVKAGADAARAAQARLNEAEADSWDTALKLSEQRDKALAGIDAKIAAMRTEAHAYGMSDRESAVFRAGQEVEIELRRANIDLLSEEARERIAAAKDAAGRAFDAKEYVANRKKADEAAAREFERISAAAVDDIPAEIATHPVVTTSILEALQ